MFSRIRGRLTYTNTIVTLALVFAMTGGAYAAKHYVVTSTSQVSPKVLKALQGKSGKSGAPGAAGAVGPAGPAGPAGAKGESSAPGVPGAKGDTGPAGPAGAKGDPGAPGAKGSEGPEGPEGPAGTKGAPGSAGPEGSPWTAGGTLPSGSTESGAWSATGATTPVLGSVKGIVSSISFGIPLAKAPVASVILPGEGEGEPSENLPAGCKGNVAEPKAESGNLCIFVSLEKNAKTYIPSPIESPSEIGEAGKTGAALIVTSSEENVEAFGTWAVTG